ncbi:MAG: hypothetical protein ACO1OC_06305 [Tuberibacillus sp.]
MKPKAVAKRKMRGALKQWLKERLGNLQPKQQQGTASNTKLSA